ncbi:MAG: hypothetical protein WCI41_00855 [bacterium]
MDNIKSVLEIIQNGDVFELTPNHFRNRFMSEREMKAIFDYFDAFWQYKGGPSPQKPHAILKSEKHSNGFISCKNVLDYPVMCHLFAYEIVKHILIEGYRIDAVAGSAYSAIDLSYEVAKIMAKEQNPKIRHFTVEKDKNGNPTIIRGGIPSNLNVLVINELMTTGSGSTWETKQAVLNCNGDNPPPKVIEKSYVLVHRSKDYKLPDGSKVVPVFHFDIEDFEPENCPYCKAGSLAIKPKVGNNWNLIHMRA